MNNNVYIIHFLIGISIFLLKYSLSFNPIRFHCDNYVLNTYLYFILSLRVLLSATNSALKSYDVSLEQLFSGPFTILLALSSICLLYWTFIYSTAAFFTKHILYIIEMMLSGILFYLLKIINHYFIAITTLSMLAVLTLVTFSYLI